MNLFVLWFVKITGLPFEHFYYRKKVYTDEGAKRLIKGGALIVSNHNTVYDYPLIMYTFLRRNIRTLVAEIMFQKNKFLTWLIGRMGAIRVDRKDYNFAFAPKMIECLRKGECCLVFPEAKVPDCEMDDFLPFKPSYVYMALESGAPIVPVYVNGIYGKRKKEKGDVAKIMIGKEINVFELFDESKSDKENIEFINDYVRNYIKELKVKTSKMK